METLLPLQQKAHICTLGGEFRFFYAKDVSRSGTRGGALKRNRLPTLGKQIARKLPSALTGFAAMDVKRRPGLKDALLALLLAVLQGCPQGETAPDPSPLVGSNWGNPRRYIHLQTSTDTSNFYLEVRLDGTVRKSTARTPYSKNPPLYSEREREKKHFSLTPAPHSICIFFPPQV